MEIEKSGEEKEMNETPAEKKYEIVGIRFKNTGKVYFFDPAGFHLVPGDKAIVETARGTEYGFVLTGNKMVSESEVVLPLKSILRKATADDDKRYEYNKEKEGEAFKVCEEKIAKHKLGMKLVDVEYTFDNSKLLFYFTSEDRVDFRELVKDLASVFKTRIELRQIGIRDETKMVGGIGTCGRPFCCNQFLDDFCQVSIKMAKDQNLSLNSQKISGACGRLMCCLRYEESAYAEALAQMPKVGSIVETPDGNGTVSERRPLQGLVRVKVEKGEDSTYNLYPCESLKVIKEGKDEKDSKASKGKNTPKDPNASED